MKHFEKSRRTNQWRLLSIMRRLKRRHSALCHWRTQTRTRALKSRQAGLWMHSWRRLTLLRQMEHNWTKWHPPSPRPYFQSWRLQVKRKVQSSAETQIIVVDSGACLTDCHDRLTSVARLKTARRCWKQWRNAYHCALFESFRKQVRKCLL